MQCMPWVLTFIETAPTARDAWETLRKHFQPSSTSAKIFIKREFYSTKLGKNDDINEHIHKLCHLYQDLMIAGFNMPKAEFTSVVLMLLPPSWDSFISTINGEDLESTDPEVSKKAADSILSRFQSEAMCQKSHTICQDHLHSIPRK